MAKDIGMTIRKGIVVPFLPCLVAFWGFHPYMFFHFLKCFFVTFNNVIVSGANRVIQMLEEIGLRLAFTLKLASKEKLQLDSIYQGCGGLGQMILAISHDSSNHACILLLYTFTTTTHLTGYTHWSESQKSVIESH